jgi:hypothetical protein
MLQDIRDVLYISQKDLMGLNFIKMNGPHVFRRHFRQGLRSHVLEVLHAADLERERNGILINGIKQFPKARPRRMFRIFRTRLGTLENALAEIHRLKITERFLAPEFMARSNEIIVEYNGPRERDLLLCGIQEYVPGVILDPWSLLDAAHHLSALYQEQDLRAAAPQMVEAQWISAVRHNGDLFIERIKQMVLKAGYIPDLAGIGNILISPAGQVKLVDINNISKAPFDEQIRLDDRGYPVCDKSVEALFLLEEKLLGRPAEIADPIYKAFLNPQRKKQVEAHTQQFES